MRHFWTILTSLSFALCLAFSALWYWSARGGRSVYVARAGIASAAVCVDGEVSFWLARIDRRCTVRATTQYGVPERAFPVPAVAWLGRERVVRGVAVKGLIVGRVGLVQAVRFRDVFPTRMLRSRVIAVAAPLWLLVLLTAALPVLRAAIAVRRRVIAARRGAAGRCLGCGYDLRGIAGRCPECGNPVDAASGTTRRPMIRHSKPALVGTMILLATAGCWFLASSGTDAKAALSPDRATLLALESKAALSRKRGRTVYEYQSIAEGYARLGEEESFWRNALPAERLLEDTPEISSTPTPLASAFLARGDFESLRAVTHYGKDDRDPLYTLEAIGRSALKSGRRDVLTTVLRLLNEEAARDPDWRMPSHALFIAANLQMEANDLADAAATIEGIPGIGYRANAIDHLADAYFKAGNEPVARELLRRAEQLDRMRPYPPPKRTLD